MWQMIRDILIIWETRLKCSSIYSLNLIFTDQILASYPFILKFLTFLIRTQKKKQKKKKKKRFA